MGANMDPNRPKILAVAKPVDVVIAVVEFQRVSYKIRLIFIFKQIYSNDFFHLDWMQILKKWEISTIIFQTSCPPVLPLIIQPSHFIEVGTS